MRSPATASDATMPCTFRFEHPWRPSVGCQFEAPEAELVLLDGRSWCRFHLPLKSGEAQSEKACWDDRQVASFNEDVIARINQSEDQVDLSGVVFPSLFTLRYYAHEKDKSSFLLFFESTFCNDATFDNSSLGDIFFGGATFAGKASFVNSRLDTGRFDGATFHNGAAFNGADFGIACFQKVRFGRGPASAASVSAKAPTSTKLFFSAEPLLPTPNSRLSEPTRSLRRPLSAAVRTFRAQRSLVALRSRTRHSEVTRPSPATYAEERGNMGIDFLGL